MRNETRAATGTDAMAEHSSDHDPRGEATPPEPDVDARTPHDSAPDLDKRLVLEAVSRELFGHAAPSVTLDRFVILGTLGRGGMGAVFKAYDESLDRTIAIKRLHPGSEPRREERLRREAQALAKLSHPNVVQVYEVGEAEGSWFIAMELVKGQTLRRWNEGEHDWRARVHMHMQAGAGLAAAHAVGLVHRDFKPDNCIIDDDGRLRVLDFGIAKDARTGGDSEPSASETQPGDDDGKLTRPGTVLGTRGYASPEQLRGDEVDHRSDQFSLCASLYESLYGQRPFAGESMAAVAMAIDDGEIRPAPRGSLVPASVREVVTRGLAADPDARWPSMNALLAALRDTVAPVRRRWVIPAAVLGLLAVGLGVASYAREDRRCEGAQEHLEGVWDDARRQQVREAIESSGLSFAADTWQRVEPQLDAYAQEWAAKHTEACEATSLRGEQSAEVLDLRMTCLRGRRAALDETTKLLAQHDPDRVGRAVPMVEHLPSLDRCDDVAALRAALPPPEDPAVAEQVQVERELRTRAWALLDAGELDEGLTLAEQLVARAEELDYPPLLAEALYQRGVARTSKVLVADGVADIERAYLLATELGHGEVEAKAAVALVSLVGSEQSDPTQGLWWSKIALALAARFPDEPSLRGDAFANLGIVLQDQGRLDESLDYTEQALHIYEQVYGPESPQAARSLLGLGTIEFDRGRYEEALPWYRRALSNWEQAYGPRHPAVGHAHLNIGNVYIRLSDYDQALAELQHALEILEAAGDPVRAKVLTSIGFTLDDLERHDEALESFARAIEVYEQTLGPAHPNVANTMLGMATVLNRQGQPERALETQQLALAKLEQAVGPDHADVAGALSNTGATLRRLGRRDEALTMLRRALEIKERTLGPEHPGLVTTLNTIGNTLRDQGDLAGAREALTRALQISEAAFGAEHSRVALSLLNLGLVVVDQGDAATATGYFERTIAIWEALLGPEYSELSVPLWALSEIAIDEQDYARAKALCERALKLAEGNPGTSPDLLAALRFVHARALWPERSERARARALAQQAYDAFATMDEVVAKERAEVQAWLAEHR